MRSLLTTMVGIAALLAAACQGTQSMATGATGGKGSGTASAGATSGGNATATTGGSTGSSVCTAAVDQNEFTLCTDGSSACDAGLRCTKDPNFSGMYCEYSCRTSADCPDLITVCVNGNCASNLCGPGTGNGEYDGICNAAGSNDGTCFPLDSAGDGGHAAFGYCQQAGTIRTVGQACKYDRCPADDLCAPGWDCVGEASFQFLYGCLQLCDPSSDANDCPSGRMCSAINGSSDYGGCFLLDGGL